jgi:hypothetical protein
VATDAKELRWILRKRGFSDTALEAAWPTWWSDDANDSASANTELRFSLARKLGLDPRSLIDEVQPRFVWREAKFKRLTGESDFERNALSSFGISIGRSLVSSTQAGPPMQGMPAVTLRQGILANQPFVRLVDLLGLCWAVGIPVIHLRVFPLSAKRMCAMAVHIAGRYAILLGKDASYPASIAYYLAHEIGHIALGHFKGSAAIVDLQDPLEDGEVLDEEEQAADAYALALLTGNPEFAVSTETRRFSAAQLAQSLLATAHSVRVEPGTLALCFGHSTQDWAKTHAALKLIYTKPQAVWSEVNHVAVRQLDWSAVADDFSFFLRAVMGGISDDDRRN